MAKGELHVQLYINYADDEKLAHVSRSARLLYVDALCAAKRLLNDGIFTAAQVHKIMHPASMATAKKTAAELVESGAFQWDEQRQSYVVAAWLKRNKSRAQVEADRAAAEESALHANHKRWHVGRKEPDAKCRWCVEEGMA